MKQILVRNCRECPRLFGSLVAPIPSGANCMNVRDCKSMPRFLTCHEYYSEKTPKWCPLEDVKENNND